MSIVTSLKEIHLAPHQHRRILLGSFASGDAYKGFVVEISPDPAKPGLVTTEIISQGTQERYKLMLQVANYSSRMISANVTAL